MVSPLNSCDKVNVQRMAQADRKTRRKASSQQPAQLQANSTLFTATPAMKAARRRAWKTYQGYSQDEIDDKYPATSFVTLRSSSKRLEQLQASSITVLPQTNDLSKLLLHPEPTAFDIQTDATSWHQLADEQTAIDNKNRMLDDTKTNAPGSLHHKRPRHDSHSLDPSHIPTNQKMKPRISTKGPRNTHSGEYAGLIQNPYDLPSLRHRHHFRPKTSIANRNLRLFDSQVLVTDDDWLDQTSIATEKTLSLEKNLNLFSSSVSLPVSETGISGDITDTDTPNWPTCPFQINPRDEAFEGNPVLKAMAPVRDPNNVEGALKDAVQTLYEVQSQVHGFVPETQPLLVDKMTELARSLAHLQTITSPTSSPNNPIHKYHVAPEIIDYVDDSRNPDIYNREFVELVQRGNAVINGKQQAFRDFSEIFALALKQGFDSMDEQVDKIMSNAGLVEKTASNVNTEAGPTNGSNKQ